MLAALLLAAGSFAAGWSLSDRSDSRPKGSCVAGQLKEEYGPTLCLAAAMRPSSNTSRSILWFAPAPSSWASADAGVYFCTEPDE
jgi:hypothetical protein